MSWTTIIKTVKKFNTTHDDFRNALMEAWNEIREHITGHYKRPAEAEGEPVDWMLAFLDLDNAARWILDQLIAGKPIRWTCPWCEMEVQISHEEETR